MAQTFQSFLDSFKKSLHFAAAHCHPKGKIYVIAGEHDLSIREDGEEIIEVSNVIEVWHFI
jgi:hypothetical protein